MIVYFDNDFYQEYSREPAAEKGRMEAIVDAIDSFARIEPCLHALKNQGLIKTAFLLDFDFAYGDATRQQP